jgi:PAS domain S-box-containing protein
MNFKFLGMLSLKTRMTLFTLAIFLIGIWSLAFYTQHMLREDMQHMLSDQQFSTVSILATKINQELDDRLRALERIARGISPAIIDNDMELQTFLEQRILLQSLFNGGAFITGIDGTATASIPFSAERIGRNYMDRDYIAAVFNEGKSIISRPVMGRALHSPVFAIAVPILDTRTKVISVLAGVTDLGKPNFLDSITEGRYGKAGGYVLIEPQSKIIITATDKTRIMTPLPAPGINPMLDRYMQGFEGSGTVVDSLGLEVLSSAKRISVAGWFLVARVPTEEAFSPIHAMQRRMLLIAICMSLVVCALTWWTLRILLSPMLAAVAMLALQSNTDQPPHALPITSHDEIGELIGGFNLLLETLKQRDEKLRESEEKHMGMISNISDVISIMSRDRTILYLSPNIEKWFGWQPEDIVGTDGLKTVHPEDLERTQKEFISLLDKDNLVSTVEYRYICKDGKYKLIELTAVNLTNDPLIRGVLMNYHDITERKNAEKTLRKSEREYRSTVDGLLVGVVVHDADTRILNSNQEASNILGLTAEQLSGKEVIDPAWMFVNEDLSPMKVDDYPVSKVISTKKPLKNYVLGIIRSDRLYVTWVNVNAMPLVFADAKLEKIIVNFLDITERKLAEEKLRASDENFRSIFENNSVAMAIFEPDSTISMVNEEYCKVGGYTKQEVLGMSWTQQILPKDLERLKEFTSMRLIAPEDAPDKYEFAFYHKNGEIKHALMSVTMLSNRKIVASFIDITDRKRAEETIRKISAAVEQSPVTIVITDTTGAIEYVNPKFTETTGYTFSEAIGQNPRILKSGELRPEAYKELWNTILAGEIWRGEFHNKKKNGELFWEHASISPIRDAQGTIISFVAVKEDITERKRIEEELHHLNETLELRVAEEVEKNLRHEHLLIQQSRMAAMGEMIGNIAHQWRQPLNSLGILLFNIKDEYHFNTLDATYLDQAVADGSRIVQKMSTTISDFANFFHPDKEIKIFSALEQVKEAIALVESSFNYSHISILIDAPLDLKLLGFPNEYSQVLLNLLTNAKEAILAHSQPHAGRVDIALAEQDGHGCVSVCDNGGGIHEEILSRIFDPYFSTKGKGSGIGLYMSKMIIERNMNGSITARNIEEGVEFIVCVPHAKDGSHDS